MEPVRRKIADAADAAACLAAITRSGVSLSVWCRPNGVDGRSLRIWHVTQMRREGRVSHRSRRAEFVATPRKSAPQLTIRNGEFPVDVARGIKDMFTRDDAAVFTFSMSKDGKDFASKLAKFEGTRVADAESHLNATCAHRSILADGCNTHGRRTFEAAGNEQPILAVEGGTFLAASFLVEEEAATGGIVGAELLALRQSRTAPFASEFRKWIDAVGPDLLPGTLLKCAVN